MNLDNLKNKQKHISKILLCLSGLLAVLTGANVYAFVSKSAQLPRKIEKALDAPGRKKENVKKHLEEYAKKAADLKKKSLFMPPKTPQTNPVKHVTAVLGDEACISNEWYKVGQKIKDAEITRITPNEVTILWNDKETKLKPFDTVVLAPTRKPEKIRPRRPDRPEEENVQNQQPQMTENRPAPMRGLTEEERQKRRQEFLNRLSPEQRERFEQRMRERGSRGNVRGGTRGRPGRGNR